MMRQEARFNKEVNGYFICDRGRFGFDFANHADRIRAARVESREATWEQAIEATAAALKRIHRQAGADSILCLGSARSSLEAQGALKRLCKLLGWPEPKYFVDSVIERKVKAAVTRLDVPTAASLEQVEEADFILSLGADPVNEAPMLAVAMRQARRKDATVVVADPRPVFLPFDFYHFPLAPQAVDNFAGAVVREALTQEAQATLSGKARSFYESLPVGYAPMPGLKEKIEELGRKLSGSKKPVIVCGTDLPRETTVALASDLVHLLQKRIEKTRLFYVLPGPNAFGAGLLTSVRTGGSFLDSIEAGRIKALILVEQDPFWLFPDQRRLETALDKLEYLLVLDYLPSPSAKMAHAVLPTTTLFERTSVTFVNQEGRAQNVLPVHNGGRPLSQVRDGNHPPRTFLDHIPGGDPRASHEVLAELYAAISGQDKTALLKGLWEDLGLPFGVPRLLPEEPLKDAFTSKLVPFQDAKDGMELFLVDWTFGTEELSCYSRFTVEAENAPRFQMHPDDAARLGLAEGDRIAIALNGEEFSLKLSFAPSMAPGIIIAPRHRQVRWQKLKAGQNVITDQEIYKL